MRADGRCGRQEEKGRASTSTHRQVHVDGAEEPAHNVQHGGAMRGVEVPVQARRVVGRDGVGVGVLLPWGDAEECAVGHGVHAQAVQEEARRVGA